MYSCTLIAKCLITAGPKKEPVSLKKSRSAEGGRDFSKKSDADIKGGGLLDTQGVIPGISEIYHNLRPSSCTVSSLQTCRIFEVVNNFLCSMGVLLMSFIIILSKNDSLDLPLSLQNITILTQKNGGHRFQRFWRLV